MTTPDLIEIMTGIRLPEAHGCADCEPADEDYECMCDSCGKPCSRETAHYTREQQLLLMATWVAGMIREEEDRLAEAHGIRNVDIGGGGMVPLSVKLIKLKTISSELAQIKA